jgi:hypothetical protein
MTANDNITVSLPPGYSQHGDPHLLCKPAQWYEILAFFLTNYVAHAATVITSPGQHWTETLEISWLALLVPVSGIARAVSAVSEHSALEKAPIQQAARAGALCMVGRRITTVGDFKLTKRDSREWWDANNLDYYDIGGPVDHFFQRRSVNGGYKLTDQYCLLIVPPKAPISASATSSKALHVELASSLNIAKLLISLAQTAFAIASIYRARSDQIERFGYAAFGLTVVPFGFMSIMNILGNCFQPEYPSMFLIRTPMMQEAERNGCYFENELDVEISRGGSPTNVLNAWRHRLNVQAFRGGVLAVIVLLPIIGGLSGFRGGQSTSIERGFTMAWLAVSLAFGPYMRLTQLALSDGPFTDRWGGLFSYLVMCGAPGIGGMVVVGKMIQKFGLCVRI